jgi:hypothetical protein
VTNTEIQKAVCDIIKAEPWFKRHGYEPVPEASGNLDDALDAAIDEGTGCAILVSIGTFEPQGTDAKSAPGTLEVRCAVAENPPLNRAKARWAAASQAAEYLAHHLNTAMAGNETLYGPAYRPDHTPDLLRHVVTLKMNHVLEGIPPCQES